MSNSTEVPQYTLWQMGLYMLRLGTFGVGGPVARVGYMHRDLVEDRKWITEAEYKEGVALSQLASRPQGPRALKSNSGYAWGATLAGPAFVILSFLMVVAWLGVGPLRRHLLNAGGVLRRRCGGYLIAGMPGATVAG
jgi:chromate transporter